MRRLFWVCLVLAACKSNPAATPADAATTVTSTATQARPFDALAGNLFGQLVTEKNNRPPNTPKIEDVVALLRTAGIKVKDPEQGLGATVRAKYCAVAVVNDNVGFSMCEYADEKSLAIGRDIAENQYKIAGRSFYTNKTTLLGMRPMQENEQAKKDMALIVEAFNKL